MKSRFRKVLAVSARTGVPITTQWDKRGYYYATQICQYALAHWSKAASLQSGYDNRTVFEDGNNTFYGEWKSAEVNRITRDRCVHFDTPTT